MIWNQKRFWLHFPAGIIGPLLILAGVDAWVFVAGWITLWMVYEITEGKRPWIDIQGIIAGWPIGVLAVWLIRSL